MHQESQQVAPAVEPHEHVVLVVAEDSAQRSSLQELRQELPVAVPHEYDVAAMPQQIARDHGVLQVQQFGAQSQRGAVALAVKYNLKYH